ncbi:hypothetical protein KSP39_PZI016351 [Platanthera zijinensis]|uniref:Uncharacterized protein n=1 Tax=Platanthera zijinensis TaxID=2320716 RepID=A0AAP0B6T7_9ASPA
MGTLMEDPRLREVSLANQKPFRFLIGTVQLLTATWRNSHDNRLSILLLAPLHGDANGGSEVEGSEPSEPEAVQGSPEIELEGIFFPDGPFCHFAGQRSGRHAWSTISYFISHPSMDSQLLSLLLCLQCPRWNHHCEPCHSQ